MRTWSQGIERAFAEVAVRIRARHSLPDWVSSAGQLLQNVLGYIETESSVLFKSMSNPEIGRFLRSLSTISAAQMELGPEPAVLRRSLVPVWIVGYFAIDYCTNSKVSKEESVAERKISSESTGSEKSSESVADAYEMKQLKYYPDLGLDMNFLYRRRLLQRRRADKSACLLFNSAINFWLHGNN